MDELEKVQWRILVIIIFMLVAFFAFAVALFLLWAGR